MRQWRVGTFSMGATLLLLGVFLLLSQFAGLALTHVMMAWWPVILVILGIEILLFLFFSKQEKPYLKYDFLSIFFVGVIGTVGIGFAVISASGLVEKVNEVLQREERTMDLPDMEMAVKPEVKRVVVDTKHYPLTVEGTTTDSVSMFGTYRALVSAEEEILTKAEDYVSLKQKGDTLYILVKGIPTNQMGPLDRNAFLSATLLVPNDRKLEVIGDNNAITMKPKQLLSDWKVQETSSLLIHLPKESDIELTAKDVMEFSGEKDKWIVAKNEAKRDNGNPGKKNAIFQTGNGSYSLEVLSSYDVIVHTVE